MTANGGTGNPDTEGPAPNWGFAAGGGGRVFLRYELLNCANYDAISAWEKEEAMRRSYGGLSFGGKRGLIGGAGTISHFITQNNITVVIGSFPHSSEHLHHRG